MADAALERLVAVLEEIGIPYAIGGSVASSSWSRPRSTNDTDLVVGLAEQHLPPLVERLTGEFYVDATMVREAFERKRAFNIIHLKSYDKFDLFVAGDDPLDRAQLARSVRRKLRPDDDRAFHVTSCEVILLRKLDWYRRGGEVSERQWSDVLELLRIQRGNMDQGFLSSLADRVGLGALLQRAQAEAES